MASCFPLHTCELCGQEGLAEADMRTHMKLEHVEGSPMCPFCDLGALSHDDMELHVNSAHLDFLTPESDDMQYLEGGGGMGEWKSIWELDKCAGEEGLAGGLGESPPYREGRDSPEGGRWGGGGSREIRSDVDSNGRVGGQAGCSSDNPFVDSDLSDTEEDTTVCSVVEKVKDRQEKGEPPKIHVLPNSNPESPRKRPRQDTPSPKLNKSHLTLPLRRPTGGCSPVLAAPLTCPMCPHTDTNPEALQEHVNRVHLDDLSPMIQSPSHPCPLYTAANQDGHYR